MTMLNPFDAARSSRSLSSVRCESADSVLLDGQSMLATVAIHTPRASRVSVGGVVSGSVAPGAVIPPASPQAAAAQSTTAPARRALSLECTIRGLLPTSREARPQLRQPVHH